MILFTTPVVLWAIRSSLSRVYWCFSFFLACFLHGFNLQTSDICSWLTDTLFTKGCFTKKLRRNLLAKQPLCCGEANKVFSLWQHKHLLLSSNTQKWMVGRRGREGPQGYRRKDQLFSFFFKQSLSYPLFGL